MSATSGGGGSVSEGSEAGGSSHSTMSVSDSPSTSFQANLPENVTKITLTEENGAGGFGADVTGSKINLSLDERHQKDGIVNVAFDYEEGATRGGGGGGGGGDFKSINGSEKKDRVPEAVNLELVNMVPYSNGNGTSYGVPVNGIPMKKDSEQVDMNTPYDEYFVPVNEHKKYMRGEKLYVTKDKRRPTSWRRCLSWIVACTVISVVLIVAILAGTGVILSQEPNLVKEASVGRNFAGSNLKPSVTNKSPAPTAEMYMYVPRSIESEFVIDNLDFDPAFKDRNSSAYQQFATNMEDQLKMLLFDKETLEFGASDVGLKVVNISRDPFKVNYRIGWNYEQGVNNPPEPIKMEDVKKRLVESLARNQGYIDKYHIDREAIKVNHVINTCQMENGGCSHICYYNYVTQQFTCTCPTHLVLDNSGKNCVAWTGSEDDAVPVPSHADYPGMPYESTASPVQEQEFGVHHEHGVHQGVYHGNDGEDDYKYSSEDEHEGHGNEYGHHEHHGVHGSHGDHGSHGEHGDQESHGEHGGHGGHGSHGDHGDYGSHGDHGGHGSHGDHEPEAEPAPEPTAEPGSDTKVIYDGQIVHSSYDNGNGGAAPEPTAEPNSDDKYHDYSVHSEYDSKEPSAEPTSEPNGEQDSGNKSHELSGHSVFVSKEHEPSAEPTPEPAPEPTAETNAEGKGHEHMYGFKDHEPAAEPTPEPAPEPTAEHDKDHHHDSSSAYGAKDHEPAAEPTPEPAPEPSVDDSGKENKQSHGDHSVYVIKDHESTAEPAPEPEPAAEPNSESKTHDYHIHPVYGSEDHEPAAEPTPEPTSEHQTETIVYHHDGSSAHKTEDHEPSAEPTPEPSAEPNTEGKNHDHAHHTDYESKEHEPSAEPAPEPAAEEDSKGKDSDSTADSVHGGRNPDSATKSTPESVLVGHPYEHDTHSVYESKTEGKEDPQLDKVQKSGIEPAPEPTPEPSSDTESPNSGSNERTEIPSAAKDITSDSQPSLQNSNQESSLGSVQTTEAKTEYSMKIHPTMQRDSIKENKSGHHMPHLEDILIRKPNLYLENQNSTGQNQNPLQNVELTANGEPVIEEVIIKKSGENSTDQVGQNPSHSVMSNTESDPNASKNVEGFSNQNMGSAIYSDDSSTKRSVIMTEGFEDPSSQPEIPTDHPKIIEYSEIHSTHKIDNDKETGRPDFGQTGNSKDSFETTIRSNVQDPVLSSQHFSEEDKKHSMEDMTRKPDDQEYKLAKPSESNLPITTMHPEIQYEYHTIPVAVDVSGSVDSATNVEKKPEMHETNIRVRDMSAENPESSSKGVSGPTETEHQVKSESGADQSPKGEERDQLKTSTESNLPMTTLLTILTPGGFEKISGQDQGAAVKEIQNEDKTNLKSGQAESHETTKSPEEISNNIKDELLDNEAFNTLIDKEYKNKEGIPTEGKEIINKYPNKSLKTDKKKIKDYVKGEKPDLDKKPEVTARPGVTPEDFILQKHVNGHENTFDLEYSLQNEHTTKHDGGVTIIDPHAIPGVSFKPHGINNHDLSVLQTISPDFKTETIFPSGIQEPETVKPDSNIKVPENKDEETKLDRDYKFDKDYKYEKQKVSKKKDLKKKIGGKDGKNVELDDGRKYYADVSKDDWDVSQEGKDVPETTMNPSFEKVTVQPEIVVKNLPEFSSEETAIPGSNNRGSDSTETTFQPHHNFEIRTEVHRESVTEYPKSQSGNEQGDLDKLKISEQSTSGSRSQDDEKNMKAPVDGKGHLMIDEPSVKSTFNVSPGTVYDEQLSGTVNQNNPQIIREHSTSSFSTSGPENAGISGTVFDGMPQGTIVGSGGFGQGESGQNTTVVYKTIHSLPEIVSEGGVVNSTKAHPTIIIHGQSGNLQDGHIRFANSTLHNPGNATVISTFNGTLTPSEGHSFGFTNYTVTFPNGSAVHPTIVVRGQSGALQDGHESRFGNSTFQTFTTYTTHSPDNGAFKNSQVYRIENSSFPGTVFDGNFSPKEGHYHMYTNSSGTFVYTNGTNQPVFKIKGQSGDFGNATAYILENGTSNTFSGGFVVPDSVVFRNSTVFAVESTEGSDAGNVREILLEPHTTSNDTIHFTHQMSPSFVSSGTAYKVNNYFGYISKCAAGQYQCVNGTSKRGSACISLSSKCDSINDCSDGSDELGCIEKGCPGNFQCSDGTCLKRNLVCNGILDCSDGSDEKNCESWKCEFDEFQCPSGRCIPVVWQCDNKPDCDNHTDEYNCQTSCGNDEYLCPEGWCIPLTYKCNGIKECTNGEDEQLCDCSHEEFKCQTGGCISMKQVCNGLDDCPDRSDEWDCVKLEQSSNLLKIRSPSGDYEPVCADNWSSRFSDQVCASLGYFSSVPIENENSSITTETSFYVLKNDTTADFNKKIIVNLKKSEGNCSSGKLVEISCQEFSCGSRSMTDSSSVEARLVGGMSATAGQWPSVALLYNIRNFHSCTANVLTPRWVLASYNCLKMGNFRNKNLNEQDWKFYGGSTVFESERENAETRKILSIIPHPQVKFNQFLFTNDLALVELDQSLQFTSNLGAVCLPEQEMQPRQICVTAGWGMNNPEDKAIRQQLQYLPVPTMNLTECNSTEHYSGFITDDKICAGYNSAQKSLCYNEEGAPLMCVNDRGEWELQGVLSYHSNCGRGSHPSIFSSITPVTDWIKKTIGNNFDRKVLAVTNR